MDTEERHEGIERFENALLSLDWLAAREIFSEIAGRFKGEDFTAGLEGFIVHYTSILPISVNSSSTPTSTAT